MINITTYLTKIYEDLKTYIDSDVYLCKFKALNFEAGMVPNYEDINIQQLYLLRYAFAYAFEYSKMYLDVLSQMEGTNHISVVSIGCGTMIDYWALTYALEKNKMMNSSIEYVGIDKVDWNYKFPKRLNDQVYYLIGDAKDILKNNGDFFPDVYFFPKSISEFSENQINILANSFSLNNIHKNKFFVCISLRDAEGSTNRDVQKTKCIIEAIGKNGFKTTWPYNQFTYYEGYNGITLSDRSFQYPSDALQFVKNLYMECANYKIEDSNCEADCQKYLSRSPILTVKHIRYQVIMFERMN